MIALTVFTDGRDCLHATLASLTVNLTGTITRWLLINDDPHTTVELDGWECHNNDGPTKRGFAGTIGYAWELIHQGPERFVAHWEDDFLLLEPLNLDHLCNVLDDHPELDQMALLRQPWNQTEIDAGGVLAVNPDAFTDRDGWVEHSEFFTTNPSVYRRGLTVHGWPQTRHSEGVFTAQRRAAGQRFAYWGPRGRQFVEHIGTERAGTGY